ncbi:hypothetical protein CXG81DRAFT_29844 [Caulochytrium protostelioides]|uniref:RNA-binding domain-containing protein n=1 Tax=Caulochytrium protostelioides TaxID=1555241 RepID=A0A4P9X761_9FUNG|nr:RNA-binding domain-containing protein [Caulochytrium protostelioides]RKP01064.1 hypothetical protein CXG81DRAFT_29844 [Caulochytrium protostelioides]|eukprot:RKP01064.1 hypothetical protein CXG81DRAFT_29844 [Caulochytrium protostelioides]
MRPNEANRILFVRNLPFQATSEDLYDLFGKYGAIRQIRIGNSSSTKGTGFVVYEDVYDARSALDGLSGFNIMGRYLIVLYHKPGQQAHKMSMRQREEELSRQRARLDQLKAEAAKAKSAAPTKAS